MLRSIKISIFFIISWGLIFFAFPGFSLFYLIFFAFVPFFLLIIQSENFKSFLKKSLIFSLVGNFLLIYWIVPTFMTAGINSVISFVACLFLAFYMSLYWNIFFVVFYLIKDKYFRITSILFLSSLWVLLEYARNYFLTGFSWNLLGYSQWNNMFFLQMADMVGVYGVSFFVIFFNIFITYILDFCLNKKKLQSQFLKNTLIASVLLIVIFLYGFYKLKIFDIDKYTKDDLKISVLQGNIEQYKKFDSVYFEYIRNNYTNLINSKQNDKIDIFIWPETSYPFLYPNNIEYFLGKVKVDSNHILGGFNERNKKFYNSAVFLKWDVANKSSNMLDIYSKIHLVPFGEYFPFKKYVAKNIPHLF